MYTAKIRGTSYTAETLDELSAVYSRIRDESCEGASTFAPVNIRRGSTVVASISYNGRIWERGSQLTRRITK